MKIPAGFKAYFGRLRDAWVNRTAEVRKIETRSGVRPWRTGRHEPKGNWITSRRRDGEGRVDRNVGMGIMPADSEPWHPIRRDWKPF
jgi:hypothetical protein